MQKIFKTIYLSVWMLTLLSFSTNAQTLVHSISKNDSYSYKRKDGFSSFEVQFKGDVQVNDSDTDVTSISAGGYLKINQTTFGNKRAITIESGPNGELSKNIMKVERRKIIRMKGKNGLQTSSFKSSILLELPLKAE